MGFFNFSKSKKEKEVNEELMEFYFQEFFNEAINLKRYYEYKISDRAIQIEKEYVKYLTIILSGGVMIANKNHTNFKSWGDAEFNSIVFKSVYKNCAFMERLIERNVLKFHGSSSNLNGGNKGDLRLDVFNRFNRYKKEISQSIANRKPYWEENIDGETGLPTNEEPGGDIMVLIQKHYYNYLNDIFEIKTLERINPSNNTIETEIQSLSFNEIYDEFNYIPHAIDEFQNIILRYFP